MPEPTEEGEFGGAAFENVSTIVGLKYSRNSTMQNTADKFNQRDGDSNQFDESGAKYDSNTPQSKDFYSNDDLSYSQDSLNVK